MKKGVFTLFIFLVTGNIFGTNYKIVTLEKTNFVIAFPDEKSDDKAIYVFQMYEIQEKTTIKNLANCSFNVVDKNFIFKSNTGESLTFSFNENNNADKIYNCYSVIKLGDEELLNCLNSNDEIFEKARIEIINYVGKAHCEKDGGFASNCSCAGGVGSSQCSCSWKHAFTNISTEVTCKAGFFACCPAKREVKKSRQNQICQ